MSRQLTLLSIILLLPICSCKSNETPNSLEDSENTQELYVKFNNESTKEDFLDEFCKTISPFLEQQNQEDFISIYESENECTITYTIDDTEIKEYQKSLINNEYKYDSDTNILDYYFEKINKNEESNNVENQHYYYQPNTVVSSGCDQIDLINNSMMFLSSSTAYVMANKSLQTLQSIEKEIEKLDFMELIFTMIPEKVKYYVDENVLTVNCLTDIDLIDIDEHYYGNVEYLFQIVVSESKVTINGKTNYYVTQEFEEDISIFNANSKLHYQLSKEDVNLDLKDISAY